MDGSKREIRSERSGVVSDQGVRVAEKAIGEQGIGERVIGEQESLSMSDREVIKIDNTIRNE